MLILLIVGVIISLLLFDPVIKNPNDYLFSNKGDAAKSYYNFSYYLRYDQGIRHDGINYPYGDHLQYINSHPLYVNILLLVDKYIVDISDYGVGILNLSMIFSLVIALPFIFLILRKYGLSAWYSVFISIFIIYLSPQFYRIGGHFEMVYAYFLPMFWYLLMLFREGKKRWLYGSLLVIAGLIGGFISAYYVAFYAIFILGVLIIDILANFKAFRVKKTEWIALFILAVLPLIIVRGLVTVTDWVDDRPDNPWGFFVFHANWSSIFLPRGSNLPYILGYPGYFNYNWEGRAFVGVIPTLLVITIILGLVFSLITWSSKGIKKFFGNKELNIYLFASVLILLFSMAIPFKYPAFEFLLELIPPIKQFRALGRFSWIFYYVIAVFTARFIWLHYRRLKVQKKPQIAFILIIMVFLTWSIDAGINIKDSTKKLLYSNDILQSSSEEFHELFDKNQVNPEDYQAILFLPFESTCGDKLLFDRGLNPFKQAMKYSYHTGIPLIQSFSPRLSFTHALSSIQLLGSPALEKVRLKDMNRKPILVMATDESKTRQEEYIISLSTFLFKDGKNSFWKLLPETLEKEHEKWQSDVRIKIESLAQLNSLRADTAENYIIVKGFDDFQDADHKLSGDGAFFRETANEPLLSSDELAQIPEGNYEVSFWLYIEHRSDINPEIIFYQFNKKSGKQLKREKWNYRTKHDTYGKWVRVSEYITLSSDHNYRLDIKGELTSVDNLLVKPVGSSVYVDFDGEGFYNNYPLN